MPEQPGWTPPLAGPAEATTGIVAGLAGRAVAPLARSFLHAGLYRFFRGADAADLPGIDGGSAGDAGWFGPTSVTWRVHADAAMFVGGITALLFQALHPLAMAGVSDHSDFRDDPLGRVRRTAAFVGVTAYGSTDEAAELCTAIRKVHSAVTGCAPDGRPYSAADPHLLRWVHVAEFAGFAAANRRYATPAMADGELDRYVAEVARIGEELGVEDPPRSWNELAADLESYRSELAVTEQSREAWHFLRRGHVVLPGPARPVYELLFTGAVASLPPWARQLWGVPMPSTAERLAVSALIRSLTAVMGDPPRLVAARERAARAAT